MASSCTAASPLSPSALDENIPFWNVNIPPSEHTPTCPDYLEYALSNDKDREILATRDADFVRPTWSDVVELVRTNRLDLFQRWPSDLRLYRSHCADLVRLHGSIMDFVMRERLRWASLESSGASPFHNPADFKILQNDWPYALPPKTTHLVVWTKFPLPPSADSDIGDLSPATRAVIQAFVDRTFVLACGAENVLWFKNWSALKSVHAVEHFHVLLRDAPETFVRQITGGDVSEQEKVKMERAER